MKFKHWMVMASAMVIMFSQPSFAITGTTSPMETLKAPFDKIIELLNDDSYKGNQGRERQRDMIWQIASPVFDFEEISRRAIGKSWDNFSADEKDRFIKVFSAFLGNTYIDKLQGEYNNEIIDFDKELVKGPKALVRTRLRREALVIPIDYRMQQTDGAWKIYDILVENGVSIVKNYYVQFNAMLQENTPAQLIERLQKKLDEKPNSNAAGK